MATRSRRPALLPAPILLIAAGCSTVPYTNRRTINLIPDSQAASVGTDAYKQVRTQSELITSGPQYDEALRVGKRIAAAADAPGFQREFSLIDDPKTANALCLPGRWMSEALAYDHPQ